MEGDETSDTKVRIDMDEVTIAHLSAWKVENVGGLDVTVHIVCIM